MKSPHHPALPRRRVAVPLFCAAIGLALVAAWLAIPRAPAPIAPHFSPSTLPAKLSLSPPPSVASRPLEPSASAPASELDKFRLRAAADPVASARWLAARADLAGDPAWLEQLALAWAGFDGPAALQWVRRQRPDLQPPLLLSVAGELVRAQPGTALNAALPLDPSPLRDDILRRAIAEWTRNDPDAALGWAQEIPDPALRQKLQAAAAVQLAAGDPAAAQAIAEASLPPGRVRDDALVSIFQQWAQRDPAEARVRASALSDPAARARALGEVCVQIATESSVRALDVLIDEGVAESSPALLEQFAASWIASDRNAAFQWIQQQPEGEFRDRLMKRMAVADVQEDPARAMQFVLDHIPAGNDKDDAVIAVLREWALRDPANALHWARSFPPGALRDRATHELQDLHPSG